MEAMCASHAIAWFTPDAKLIEANDRFCAIFEYDAADITGNTHDDFVAPSVRGTEEDEAFFGAFQGHGLFADTVPRQT